VSFRFSNEDVGLGRLMRTRYQNLCRFTHRLCELSYCRGKSDAGEEMRANALRQITPAPWAQIRATREKIGGQFVESKSQVAGRATSDDVFGAIYENETSLGRGQCVRPFQSMCDRRPLERSITSVVAIGCEHLEHCVRMALTSRW
jgi:hypothetical protein